MKRSSCCLILVIALAVLAGCELPPSPQPKNVVPIPTEKPKPDVSAITENAVELREEKVFLVTLKFKKEQMTLDLWKHIKNDMAAEYRALIVGERTFNEYQIDQKISSVSDDWGYIFNGEIADYTVLVQDKAIESQYFWVDHNGAQTEIGKEQYDEAMQQLRSNSRQLLTVPFAGVIRTYVMEKPLTEYQFEDRQPLNRYFVTIRVENSTFTEDLTKHIRNAANTHDITFEVPYEVFENTGDVWDNQLSTGSLILKGRLSQLQGKVIKKWVEVDNAFELVRTSDGQEFVIPT